MPSAARRRTVSPWPPAAFARRSAIALGTFLLTACTYGPVQERVHLENYRRQPDSHRFAVAVRHTVFRSPTGLNAFPNGGVPRLLQQTALLYRIDHERGTIKRVARIDAPEGLATGFRVHIDGWRDDTLFFTLSGCAGNECYGALRKARHYRRGPGEPATPIGSRPADLDPVPGMLARAPGEKTYLRVSTGSIEPRTGAATLRVRTSEGAPFVPRYRVDPSGDLARLRPRSRH